MKVVIMTICMASLAAFALDTTISNEFWCTWGYVNSTPHLQSADSQVDFGSLVCDRCEAVGSVNFSSVIFDVSSAQPDRRFSSFPPVGFMLFLR